MLFHLTPPHTKRRPARDSQKRNNVSCTGENDAYNSYDEFHGVPYHPVSLFLWPEALSNQSPFFQHHRLTPFSIKVFWMKNQSLVWLKTFFSSKGLFFIQVQTKSCLISVSSLLAVVLINQSILFDQRFFPPYWILFWFKTSFFQPRSSLTKIFSTWRFKDFFQQRPLFQSKFLFKQSRFLIKGVLFYSKTFFAQGRVELKTYFQKVFAIKNL